MNQSLSVLNTDIRVHDGLYSLNDLHRAAGGEQRHKPGNWLRIDQTRELIEEIEQCSDLSTDPIKTVNGGKAPGTYACKELVYAYAMWISAKFHLAVIRAFDTLVQENRFGAQPDRAESQPLEATEKARYLGRIVRLQAKLIKALEGQQGRRTRSAPRPFTREEDARIVELYTRGMSQGEIARRLGRSRSSIHSRIRRINAMDDLPLFGGEA